MSNHNVTRLDDIASAMVARKGVFLGVTAIVTIAAVVIAVLTPPVYRVETVVMPIPTGEGALGISPVLGQFSEFAALAGLSAPGSADRDESIAILRSKSLTMRFIKQHDLMPLLFPRRWDAQAKAWKSPRAQPSMAKAIRKFEREIRFVNDDKKTGLITLSITWRDPVQAANWANSLLALADEEVRARAIAETERSIAYLQAESSKTSVVELRQSIFRLLETQIKTEMLARSRSHYAFKVIDAAQVPDRDDPIRPKRLLVIVIGTILGLLAGAVVALVLARRARVTAPP